MGTTLIGLILTVLLLGSEARYAAQLSDYGAAQLARQAVNIQAPYLAQMAQIKYLQQQRGTSASKPSANRSTAQTTFKRSTIGWFKPWSMANEIAKKVEWDPKAPFGTGFAREEAQRQALTKLFTDCLDLYEKQAKAEGLPTDDLAVTFAHAIAMNEQLATGRKMSAAEETALRQTFREEFARSPYYWTDADKQSAHETIVITTMLVQAGYSNAVRDNDQKAQATFRDVARNNVTSLKNASPLDLKNARSALN